MHDSQTWRSFPKERLVFKRRVETTKVRRRKATSSRHRCSTRGRGLCPTGGKPGRKWTERGEVDKIKQEMKQRTDNTYTPHDTMPFPTCPRMPFTNMSGLIPLWLHWSSCSFLKTTFHFCWEHLWSQRCSAVLHQTFFWGRLEGCWFSFKDFLPFNNTASLYKMVSALHLLDSAK